MTNEFKENLIDQIISMKADRDQEKANLKGFDDKIADLTEQRNKTGFLFAQKDQLLKEKA